MALILAVSASGKSTFIKKTVSTEGFTDGDDLIPIPKGRPDPADWSQDERQEHMRGFQTHLVQNPHTICIGFSEVCIDSFDTEGIHTVIVEVTEGDFNKHVTSQHQTLRKGCRPHPRAYYNLQ